jgi:hypothetical protein
MVKNKTSATNRGLYLFMRKLMHETSKTKASGKTEQVEGCFRERMIDLHQLWYEVEAQWQAFLGSVRKRQQSDISDRLFDVTVAMFKAAVATYRGPLSYEASLSSTNLKHLIDNSSCNECGSQGDVVAILPHPVCPQWKLSCPECGFSWHTKEVKEPDLVDSIEPD